MLREEDTAGVGQWTSRREERTGGEIGRKERYEGHSTKVEELGVVSEFILEKIIVGTNAITL